MIFLARLFFFFTPITATEKSLTNSKLISQQDSSNHTPSVFLLDDNSDATDIAPLPEYSFEEMMVEEDGFDLNRVTKSQLATFSFLTKEQIQNLLFYRQKFKTIKSVYELWAIEKWDGETIKKMLPNVYVSKEGLKSIVESSRIKNVIIQSLRLPIETAEGFLRNEDSVSAYLGSKEKMTLRYRGEFYRWKVFLQAGKSSGELNALQHGFDFYGFSVSKSFSESSIFKKIIIGDFTVQYGQGLIEWQRFAFFKNVKTTDIILNDDPFRSFTSATNYRKRRGIAMNFSKRSFEFGGFFSYSKGDSKVELDDRYDGSAIYHYNYNYYLHRTKAERSRRYNTNIFSYGGYVKYNIDKSSFGVNFSQIDFDNYTSLPQSTQIVSNSPARQYKAVSTDWKVSLDNFLFFGELAIDKNKSLASLLGIQIAASQSFSFSALYRYYHPKFIGVFGNSFRNFTYTNNESGFYFGVKYSQPKKINIQFYTDVYQRPSTTFQNFQIISGIDGMLLTEYSINRGINMLLLLRAERNVYKRSSSDNNKPFSDSSGAFFSFRNQYDIYLFNNIKLRFRLDYKFNSDIANSNAFSQSYSLRLMYRSFSKKMRLTSGFYFFDVEKGTQNIFIYENDLLYNFRILQLSNSGMRYFIVFGYSFFQKIKVNLKWSQTIFDFNLSTGNSLSSINSRYRSELAVQLILKL